MIALLDPVKRYKKKCLKFSLSKKCPDILRPFYQRELPNAEDLIFQSKLYSIDFETTGIDPNNDFVLSIGGIALDKKSISFETGFHYYVNNATHVKKESAVINQITPEQLENGKDPKVAMLDLLDTISGGIVLMHCKFIEMNFIRHTLELPKNAPLPFLPFDTMLIERKLLQCSDVNDVRLAQIRKRRGFPSYDAHNALADSLSTLEVFLAQLKELYKDNNCTIKKCFSLSN